MQPLCRRLARNHVAARHRPSHHRAEAVGDDRQGAHRLSRAVPAVNGRDAPKPIIASFIAVAETEADAREMFEKYIRGYAVSAVQHYEFHNEGLADIPGYEYYGKLAQHPEARPRRFVNFLAELQVWGTPDQVFNKLAEHQRLADSGGLIGAFSYGGMPHDLAKRNMMLFAERVLPRLHALSVHSVAPAAPIRATS